MTTNFAAPRIALALSGGGIRAMAFHLGVLRAMAERGLLERVSKISTVSGGSIVAGLIFQENGLQWPTSTGFLEKGYPALRTALCSRSLIWGAIRALKNPLNWRFALSRANLLAIALEFEWGVSGSLVDLPEVPQWSINGTTAENGKRFRFKRDSLGDYELGYANPRKFPLASAMAVSAAFPGGFGPFSLRTSTYTWIKRPQWDAPLSSAKVVKPAFRWLHLYDGGIYDNLGIEPFFDAGRIAPKDDIETIVVSDAGAPLRKGFPFGPWSPFRLLRVANILLDQTHSLRVRAFFALVQQAPSKGALISIDTSVAPGPDCASQRFATSFPTTLNRLTLDEFDKLAGHGHAVAMKVAQEHGLG